MVINVYERTSKSRDGPNNVTMNESFAVIVESDQGSFSHRTFEGRWWLLRAVVAKRWHAKLVADVFP